MDSPLRGFNVSGIIEPTWEDEAGVAQSNAPKLMTPKTGGVLSLALSCTVCCMCCVLLAKMHERYCMTVRARFTSRVVLRCVVMLRLPCPSIDI